MRSLIFTFALKPNVLMGHQYVNIFFMYSSIKNTLELENISVIFKITLFYPRVV